VIDLSQFSDEWAAGLVIVGALVALVGGFTDLPVRMGGSDDDLGRRDEGVVLSRRGALLVGGLMVLVGLAVFVKNLAT
jgi:hypothetical protein